MANTLKIKRGAAASIPQGQLAEPLFTSDTYDLYIGKGGALGNQRIQNYIASGTSSQFLKGDGSLDSTTYQATSEKGQNNGYASLDSGGKVPVAQLPNSIMEYLGTWDASTNTPTLANGTGNAGDVYICSVAGTVNFGAGPITFAAGDWVVYSGSIWQKSINSNAVASVNGQTGAVVLYTDDISEDGSPTNLWFTNARARTAISATSPVQYDNSTGVISILDASASQSGVVTTGTQTFAGAKTFSSDLTINGVTAGRGGGSESTSTAFGYLALFSNTYNSTPKANTAIGYRALYSTVGASGAGGTNTAVGADALYANTTGENNTAIGVNAGRYLTTGTRNTLLGMASLFLSTNGEGNTAIGYGAGQSNTSGDFNTYVGYSAGQNYTGGSNNTIIGRYAGSATSLSDNVIIADGSGNIRFLHNGTNGKLPFLTSNGFVKTSGSDGTLSIDTNTYLTTSSASSTYLPLSGGTLTGALSGTSATFSSNVTVNNYVRASQSTVGGFFQSWDGTNEVDFGAWKTIIGSGNSYDALIYSSNASSAFYVMTGGSATPKLTITSTGAATFSSSVTAGDTILVPSDAAGAGGYKINYYSPSASSRSWKIGNDLIAYGDFWIGQSTTQTGSSYTPRLYINPSGNVGIGTSSPSYFLDVAAGTSGNFATPAARISTSTGGAGGATILQINHTANSVSGLQISQYGATPGNYSSIVNTENSYMMFGTNNTERMRITSGGAVQATNNLTANSPAAGNTGEGIIAGTSFKIDASGTGQKAKMYVVSKDLSDTYGSGLQIQFANQADDKGFGYNLTTGGHYDIHVKSAANSWDRIVRITQDGKMGIGTTNIGAKLSVAGGISMGNNTDGTGNLSNGGRISAKSTSVTGGAGATLIHRGLGSVGYFILVSGVTGSDRFVDLVYGTGTTTVNVLASATFGTAPTRTYSMVSENVNVSLSGSNTWTIVTTGLGAMES